MEISIVDYINEMTGPENKKFHCLGLLTSKTLSPENLGRAIHRLSSYDSKIKKWIESRKITFEKNNTHTVGLINHKKRIWITEIHDSFYLVIIAGLSRNDSERMCKIFFRIPWIIPSWLTANHLDELYRKEKFAKDYDTITVRKEYDPYFLRKRYSDIPPALDEETEWFFEKKFEVRVKAPRVDVDKHFSDLLKEEIVETVKTKMKIHLTNPGDSRITVDENTHIIHERGEPLATERFIIQTFETLKVDMEKYNDFIPERKYTYLEDGSLNLDEYKPEKEAKFVFYKIFDKYSPEELWIKLRNLLTYGDQKVLYSPHGLLLESGNLEFTCQTFFPVDRSEFLVNFDGKRDPPVLKVLPFHSTKIGLLTFHRVLSKKIDWKVRLC
ncbi:MAG: hypothetical protein PVF58_15495 [Candidatus Methanofastidiosia archaeon]|jgi:hypothetical protein